LRLVLEAEVLEIRVLCDLGALIDGDAGYVGEDR
jgi:hypothetical protein